MRTRRRARNVSIHAPTGGATAAGAAAPTVGLFQFTRPRGARPRSRHDPPRHRGFNSRAHGGRDRGRDAGDVLRRGFNSRAHGGRDPTLSSRRGRHCVSIHAPTGGATSRPRTDKIRRDGFNSRAHGGRDAHLSAGRQRHVVSIHAPTGGATYAEWRTDDNAAFQFTRPRGARLKGIVDLCTWFSFNSRAHGGRDGQGGTLGDGHAVSIHAPTGGATFAPRGVRLSRRVSIHAPTGGATRRTC